MAKLEIEGLDELEKQLKKLGAQATPIAKKAVRRAAPILRDAIKSQISATTHGTGDLAASITITPPRENLRGVFSVVKPSGTDRKGTSNALKFAVLEYGRKGGVKTAKSGKSYRIGTQMPKPIRQPAIRSVEARIIEEMQAVIDEETKGAVK